MPVRVKKFDISNNYSEFSEFRFTECSLTFPCVNAA